MKTIEERRLEGKKYRKTTSRKDLGIWNVETKRELVKWMIQEQEETRLKELIPVRRERMSVSPFTFFRGSAIIQAYDLSQTPGTNFKVQACGDAHISNFGIFASTERHMVFDINDFDETLPAPFEVDIKRLMASIEIAGRERSFTPDQREAAVRDAACIYQKSMMEFSEMGNMEVWYKHLDLDKFIENDSHFTDENQLKIMQDTINKALAKNSERAMKKLTETVNGKIRIKSDPPLIVPVRDLIGEEKTLYNFNHNLPKAIDIYKESIPTERQFLINQYEPVELAHKVVGIGSVGRQAWILVLMGRENGDPLVLQIKEAEQSVLEAFFGKSAYSKCGRRIVEGQRAIQTAGDILLGWLRIEAHDGQLKDYYVRQLWDSKGSFDLDKITPDGLRGLSSMCAWTLAHAHARTGDRHALAGYLGKGESFTNAMVRYAISYADQNEADYEMFLKMNQK